MPPRYLTEYRDQNFNVYVTEYKYAEATRPKDYGQCFGFHFVPSIDWDGNVSACMYLSNDPKYRLGSLKEFLLSEIIDNLPDCAEVTESCQNCCKNHEINKVLYAARQASMVNFL
jgi:MoaA/NifB/PqqE/SkfB family radical SAM enzyme